MPSLVGRTLREAEATLARYGLKVGSLDSMPSDSSPGTVVRQVPLPGRPVRAGLPVALILAIPRGPTGDDVATRVPSLIGLPAREALDSIRRVRLRPGSADSSPDPDNGGRVIRQNPAPGTLARPGSSVDVTFGYDPGVSVPPLVNLPVAEADSTLRAAGLSLGRRDSIPSAREVGLVVRQDPGPGARVRPGTPVSIWYGYAASLPVPDLVGATREVASRTLEQARLRLGPVDSVPSDREPGTVVRQSPAAESQVSPGSEVAITLARRIQVSVPDVQGLPLTEAAARLDGAGLRQGRIEQVETDGPVGIVLGQSPAAGVLVPPAAAISLDVSAATLIGAGDSVPPDSAATLSATALPDEVLVPDLMGRRLDSARAILARHRLTLGHATEVRETGGSGTIVGQVPAAGVPVAPRTSVAVRVAVRPPDEGATGRPGRSVPDLVGLDRTSAENTLAAAGFRLGTVELEPSDRPQGTVISQSPTAGTPSPGGTSVSIRLAGLPPRLLPDLVGSKAEGALAVLRRMGIHAIRIDTTVGWGPHGTVLRQSPAAGAAVTPDLLVRLHVGVWPAAWLVGVAVAGTLGAGLVARPAARRFRDQRCRRRLKWKACPADGVHELTAQSGPLLQPDLQICPRTLPVFHVLDVDGPLFPDGQP